MLVLSMECDAPSFTNKQARNMYYLLLLVDELRYTVPPERMSIAAVPALVPSAAAAAAAAALAICYYCYYCYLLLLLLLLLLLEYVGAHSRAPSRGLVDGEQTQLAVAT